MVVANRNNITRFLEGAPHVIHQKGLSRQYSVVSALLFNALDKAAVVEQEQREWCPRAVRQVIGEELLRDIIDHLIRGNVVTRPEDLDLLTWWRFSLRAAYRQFGPANNGLLAVTVREAFEALHLDEHCPTY